MRLKGVRLLFGRSGRRRAFTLAELIVSLAIFAVISAALISSLVAAAKHLEQLADYRKAADRVAAVEAFLRAPAAYCGYGMPLEPERYRSAFGNYPRAPFNWEGPVSAVTIGRPLTAQEDRRKDNALFIAYAPPGTARTNELAVLGAGGGTILLDRAPKPAELDYSTSSDLLCKSFICFGSSVPPGVILKKADNEKGTVLKVCAPSGEGVTIQKNDRMRMFRAMMVFAAFGNLYSNDFSGSGRQPRVNGICDLRFQVDAASKKLTVFIMARGDKKYNAPAPVKGAGDWPEEYRADAYANKDNHMLLVSKIVLELPNCRPKTFLNTETMCEVF